MFVQNQKFPNSRFSLLTHSNYVCYYAETEKAEAPSEFSKVSVCDLASEVQPH